MYKNKLTVNDYEQIKLKYGQMSSFAIWSEANKNQIKSNMDDISFFDKSNEIINIINTKIVLVGLNISKKILRCFGNFHPTNHNSNDYKTRYALKNTIFWGAYMTDIIKDFEEKISGKVMNFVNKNKEFENKNIEEFIKELKDVKSINPIIIAFGNDSYKILKRNLPKLHVYKVTHYSAFISTEKLRKQFIDLENKLVKNNT